MPAVAVRPFAGGVPRPRVAPARDSSACLTVIGGEMSSQQLLKKRLASELDVLHGLLKKAELISRRGACKGGGAPTAGKKEQVLASKQRSKPVEDGGNATSTKKRKISTLVLEPKPKQKDGKVAEESKDNKLAEKSKDGKVAEESKDKKLAEESKDGKVAEESKENEVTDDTSEQPPSKPVPFVVRPEEMKAQAVKCAAARAIYMPGLIYRANMRRELMEMERALALLPAESTVHPRELQGLCIKEYGRPSVMRHIGLVLKADALVVES